MHMTYWTQPIKWIICNAYDKTHNIFPLVIKAQDSKYIWSQIFS